MEHRWGQRRAAHQRVRLLTAGGIAAYGHIVNVSVSGSFIKTALPARVLSIVHIAFVDEHRRSRVFRTVAAQVVRKTAEGIGLEWCEQLAEIVDVLATKAVSSDPLTITPVGQLLSYASTWPRAE
jgi:PilZ domain